MIPDAIKAFNDNRILNLRNPESIRPWQHVLDPLAGYLILAEQLTIFGDLYSGAWNFGPNEVDAINVASIVEMLANGWDGNVRTQIINGDHPHETNVLKLDNTKSKVKLNWRPKLPIQKSIDLVLGWNRAFKSGENMRKITEQQIEDYGLIK